MGKQLNIIEEIQNQQTQYEIIMEFAIGWCKVQFKEFSAEEFKKAYFEDGNPEPEKKNIFGQVFMRLVKQKLIFIHGSKKGTSKSSRGGFVNIYISREFRERQKNNATKDKSLNLFEDEII